MHWERVCAWAKQYGVKTAFGTDMLFQPDGTTRQAIMLTRFAKVFGAVDCFRMLTSGNAKLFAMSGDRNPYKEAKLGIVEPRAWADVLLVDGSPIENIDLLHDYDRNIKVIIKDGMIHKNTLGEV